MRPNPILVWTVAILLVINTANTQEPTKKHRVGIVVHGGAGTILKSQMTAELEQEYRAKLTEAISAGYTILMNHGTSLDAAVKVVTILEDSPLFNAGKGAVFTHEGTNELDAAIMDGGTLKAGAVAAVKRIRNPIMLARLVMERSKHVLMVGEGAETFATEMGMDLVDPKYFHTDRRWKQLQEVIDDEKKQKDTSRSTSPHDSTDGKHGTAGCVALDEFGNLASATSTGGTTNKRYGRVGDTPIIGAGTYADNKTCAVSATGTGEFFIRTVAAASVAMLMEYKGLPLREAAEKVVFEKLKAIGGDGGLIAIDRDGNIAMPFNTPGMYRAYIDEEGKPVVWIYAEDATR